MTDAVDGDVSVATPEALRLAATVKFGLTNDQGGTVTFEVAANVHQVAIYAPGKEVKDVDTGALVPIGQANCPPGNLLINDTAMRIGLFQNPCLIWHGRSSISSIRQAVIW